MPYLRLTRPDNWFKNVFVLPGAVIAAELAGLPPREWLARLAATLVAACAVASANYVINEWLDRDHDRHHPEKRTRPSVTRALSARWVYALYAATGIGGLALAASVSVPVLVTAFALLAMGWIYNVPPLRSKERAYLDVLSESINNPIRLLLGWFAVTSAPLPPSSLVVAYWMGGAYLMGMKRYSEYRFIGDPEVAARYRRSFRFYTEEKLIRSSMFYALCSAALGSVFLVKYRVELVLSVPFVCLLFVWYFALALKPDSPVRHPERLWREGPFAAYAAVVALVMLLCLVVDVPALEWLLQNAFVASPRR